MATHFLQTKRLPPINTNFSSISSPSQSRRNSSSYHSPILLTPQSAISSSSSTTNTTVLPPVSCIALPMPSLVSPISAPSNGFPSPTHELPLNLSPPLPGNAHLPSYPTKRDSFPPLPFSDAFSASSYDQVSNSSTSPNYILHSNGITHSPLPNANGPLHHTSLPQQQRHHPYTHSIYNPPILPHTRQQQQSSHPDPANELLAEKRRRNAGASARFRDRRKQRERDMQEKCQFLERRVQELENMDFAKRISDLEKKLEETTSDRDKAETKIRELESEVQQLRNQLSGHEYLTPSSMVSLGDSDHKEYDIQSPEQSPEPLERVMKPTDVKSLLL